MSRVEVRIAGFGGQGVVTAGLSLARAAVVHDHKKAVQTQSFGAEARGGAARSDVVISNDDIDYPRILNADILIAMSQIALDRYVDNLRPNGLLIVERDLVPEIHVEKGLNTIRVPATDIALRKFNMSIVAVTIMIGVLVGLTGLVTEEAISKAIREVVPKESVDVNIKSLNYGLETAEKKMGSEGEWSFTDETLRT